jgi:peptidyl-prolyl cis-trans isomerase C
MISFIVMVMPALAEEKKPQSTDKVAIVNGVLIDRGEFEGEVLRIQKALLGFGKPLTCNQIASVQTEVLESMIRREVLYQFSRKSGIKPDEDAVNKEIQTLRQQFSNETEYKNELSRRNISEEMLRSRLERNSSIQQYIERQFVSKVKVTDKEMIEYYGSHMDLFKQPLQIRISHILIQTDPKWEKSRKQEARRKIEQILKNLKKGQDFAALAKEQSDGPTKANGGDLGYITTGQLDKQFESTVFALKSGETTDIIETDYGFHLFKLMDKKPETILAYENVKEKIQQFLIEEKAKQEAELHAKTLREKANVTLFLPELQNPDKQTRTSAGN